MAYCKNIDEISRYQKVIGALFLTLFLTIGCSSNKPSKPIEYEIVMFKFDSRGKDCSGVTYQWMTDLGVSTTCRERLSVSYPNDCPTPKGINERLSRGNPPSSSIMVSQTSDCMVSCEIWHNSELLDKDSGDLIASCSASIP
ncbi:MAG TPA: hypothetical protein ENG59_03850 [Chloroflexi bacterium]|nr:hypothetical protein [Chloroflexota bacterium]